MHESFEAALASLDLGLFENLSQSTEADRHSLLRVQALIRRHRPGYRYIEIGSFVGGTLLPHLRDPVCASLLSIDPRPQGAYPDARGAGTLEVMNYEGVTTEVMLQFLAQYASPEQLRKLATIDADVAQVSREVLGLCDLALVDGEHTAAAVHSDVAHLVPAMNEDGVIAFHDVGLVRAGIEAAMDGLDQAGIAHRLFLLPDVVGVLALRGSIAWATTAFEPSAWRREAQARLNVSGAGIGIPTDVGGSGFSAPLTVFEDCVPVPQDHRPCATATSSHPGRD